MQTARDSHGDTRQFIDGPAKAYVDGNSGVGMPVMITLNNTLGVFENNLRNKGVPFPP